MSNHASPRKVLVRVYTRLARGRLLARVAVAGEPHVAEGGKVELQMMTADTGAIGGLSSGPQDVLMRRTVKDLLPGATAEVSFPVAGVPRGSLCIRAAFTDRHGVAFDTETLQSQLPAPPPWFGSVEGVSQEVPPPWTPMAVKGGGRQGVSVRCWGREYGFGRNVFIRRILSGGRSLLAGPIRLKARVNGRGMRWQGSLPRCLHESPGQVVLTQSFASRTLSVAARAEIDFDGMMRIDWRLTARQQVRIEKLVMEIPIRKRYAKYFFQYRGRAGDDRRVGRLQSKRMWRNFRPYLWIGDEERGLGWFAESDENWFHADPNRAIEIAHEGEAVVLRLHLVARPVDVAPLKTPPPAVSDRNPPLVSELRYTFGLQATPVKAVTEDAWDYRTVCVQQRMPWADGRLSMPAAEIQRLAEAGVRTVVIFEHWTDIEAHAVTSHKKVLRKIVRDCHARGMQVLFYFGFLFSESAPEWRDFGDACLALPKTGWPLYKYPPQPVQTAWRVCLRSPWQDFVAAGIARVMDEFDIDGVYLDGTASPYACRNVLHGCGTVRKDASIGPTFQIFPVRSAMRRIYSVVKSRKPRGQVNVHNSANMVTPTVGWSTSTWDGEQFAGLKGGTGIEQFLPLDAFRTEFMGHQWGIPAELLCYAGKPLTFRQAWALAIVHDVPVRAMLNTGWEELALNSRIWRVMDEFDRKGATWAPYWRNGECVTASPKGMFVSLYRHPRNGVLLAVSNLERKPAKIVLKLKARRLGLGTKGLVAKDALRAKPLAVKDGQIELRVRGLDFALIRVTAPLGRC